MSAVLLAFFWLVGSATAVDVTFCVDYVLGLNDALDMGDDHITSNGNRNAKGVHVRVVTDQTGFVQDFWANDAPPDEGCTSPVLLDPAYTYTVRIFAEARVNGHEFKVVNWQTGNTWKSVPLLGPGWVPPSQDTTIHMEPAGTHEAWNVAAVAQRALFHHAPIPTTPSWVFKTNVAAGCQGAGWVAPNLDVKFCVGLANGKSLIAHEIGHAILARADENTLPATGVELNPDNCFTFNNGGWDQNSKEDNRKAAMEGFADFYAALVFNDSEAGDDCFLNTRGAQDWDLLPQTTHTQYPSCDLGPYDQDQVPNPPPGGIDQYAYLLDMCNTPLTDRGVAWDWTRFLWDMTTQDDFSYPNLSLSEILLVFDDSDTYTWSSPDETVFHAQYNGFVGWTPIAVLNGSLQ